MGASNSFFLSAASFLDITPQSYGGFMASKVVEANEGVHSLSMAVAVSLGAMSSE